MVSQAEPARSLSLRPPPSVASSSRLRRHGRSHTGGSSYVPQNDFPIFTHTGDVDISIKAGGIENRYLLHRLILTQCSGFFEASTSQQWTMGNESASASKAVELARVGENSGSEAGSSRSAALIAPRQRWRYELEAGSSEDPPMLVQKADSKMPAFGVDHDRPPPVRNKPPASQSGFFRSVANLSIASAPTSPPAPPVSVADQDLLRDYDNLFRIFYNYSPTLDSISIADAYVQCKSLLVLADLYDSLGVVGSRVDHHLLQFQGRLWKQVAKYPPSYLKLGYLARSKIIYSEALIHVVGQWPSGERYLRNQLPEQVLEIIEDKVDELAEMVAKVEGKLFRLSLTTSRGDRVTPTNSYLDWLVISFFRQYLAESTSPAPPPPTPPSRSRGRNTRDAPTPPGPPPPVPRGRIFRDIHAGGQAYLTHEECKKFLKAAGEVYSRENLKKFEKRMDELKGLAKEVVRGLMRDGLEGEGSNVTYLTCTRVDERDFPWDLQ